MVTSILPHRSDPDLFEELSLLATEKSSERRRELLSSIADMFYAPAVEVHTDSERQHFADIVGRLLKDVRVAGRAEFSTRIAPDARTPHAVALTLANDDAIDVSRPMLTHSPVLSDNDLVSIASTKTMQHRLAISKRENITERVSDTLISFGEVEVADSLTDNATAMISSQGFSRVGELASNRPSLRRKLSVREDLPLAVAREILPYLNSDDAEDLLDLMGVDGSAELDALIEKATPELLSQRAAKARTRISINSLIHDVAAGKISFDKAILQLVEGGRIPDVALGLALASDLPEQQVVNAIVSVRMEPLAVICKAVDIQVSTYIAADALRTNSVNLPKAAPDQLTLTYGKLTPEAGARSLRFVKVRNTVSPGS